MFIDKETQQAIRQRKGSHTRERLREGQVQKGQPICPSKRAIGLSFNKGYLFIPQKRASSLFPQRATCLSLKKGMFVPQKGQPVCPSKRACLSPKRGNLFVPQKGQPVHPSKRTTCLFCKRGNLFVPQKEQPSFPQKG